MTEEDQLGPTLDGTVVLDIGGDIGALVIMTPASMHRVEIEISPADETAADVYQLASSAHQDDHDGADSSHSHDGVAHSHAVHRTHVAVRERRGPGGVRYAAIYPGLRQGEYTVHRPDGAVAQTVRVTGGEVANLDWR